MTAYVMPGKNTVNFILTLTVWVTVLTVVIRVSRSEGGGQRAFQGDGWSYAHIADFKL